MRSGIFFGDIAFGAALAFLCGAFAADKGWNMALAAAFAAAGTAGFAFLHRGRAAGCAAWFAAFLLGACYVHAMAGWKSAHERLPLGSPLSFSAVISDEPRRSTNYLVVAAAATAPLEGSVTILAPPGSGLAYGDLIRVDGIIDPPDAPGDDPIVFSPQSITVLGRHRGFFVREWLIGIKEAVLRNFAQALGTDGAAFLGGILFGSKVGVSDALKHDLSVTGTTHLIAVSGYKVTLVIVTTGAFFLRVFSRRVAHAVAIVFLCLFILMVGFEASAIRAAIMGVIALAAKESGGALDVRNAITFTALAMALTDPWILTNDLSFIISFLAVLGIVYLGPPFKALFRFADDGLFGWKEAAVTTLSAQLATMPVLMSAFGQFSLIAIPANVLTLSLLPITMCLGTLLALLGLASAPVAYAAAKLAGFVAAYQLFVIRALARVVVPVPFPAGSAFAVVLYYLALAIFAFMHVHRRRARKI